VIAILQSIDGHPIAGAFVGWIFLMVPVALFILITGFIDDYHDWRNKHRK
jgi:hypothetical protein